MITETLTSFFTDLLKVAPGMPDGMTFDVKVSEDTEANKVKVTGADPTILSLEDIMTLDDDLDLGLDEDEVTEDKNEIEKVGLPLFSFNIYLCAVRLGKTSVKVANCMQKMYTEE